MAGFFTWLSDTFNAIITVVLALLPKSPFVYIEANPVITDILGYANYFVPISSMISIAESWLIAIGIYYLYVVILRWIQAVD